MLGGGTELRKTTTSREPLTVKIITKAIILCFVLSNPKWPHSQNYEGETNPPEWCVLPHCGHLSHLLDGFLAREEVQAFRDKTPFGDNDNNGDGCYSGRKDCAERPGEAHTWMYVDDLTNSIAGDWELPGTPFSVILDGGGTVVWNQAQSDNHPPGEEVGNALARLLGGE